MINSKKNLAMTPCHMTSKLNSYVESKIPQNVTFKIPFMKENDLLSIINSLDPNKATGIDGISAKLLKKQYM